MGIFSLCAYAAVNSRIHYAKSLLLDGNEWRSLSGTDSLPAAMGNLSSTALGESLSCAGGGGAGGDTVFLRDLEHSLHQTLIKNMLSHLRFLSGAPAESLIELVRIYDLMNLKKAVRIEFGGRDRIGRLSVKFYDLGKYSIVSGEKWEEFASGKIGRSLEGTCYGEDYRIGKNALDESGDILRLETLLEKRYFTTLGEKLKKSGGYELLERYMNELTLMQMARLRYHYKLEAPAILPLLMMELSGSFNEKVFSRLMEAGTEEAFFAALSREKGWSGIDCSGMSECVRSLRKEMVRECRKILKTASPMSFRPLLACFILKRQELRDVIAVLQMKRFARGARDVLVTPQTLKGRDQGAN
ncbi:V-type ATPase subunit [bacterium]|nr:V-type ATPase subunit [bacterium]